MLFNFIRIFIGQNTHSDITYTHSTYQKIILIYNTTVSEQEVDQVIESFLNEDIED